MPDFVRTRRSLFSALLSMCLLAGTVTTLGGCNTTAGLGQDVSATGKAVTNSAEKVKQGL
jgi:predicted small secreted protein